MKGGGKYSVHTTYKDVVSLLFLVRKVYHFLVYFNLWFLWVGSHHRKCVLQIIVQFTTMHQNRLSQWKQPPHNFIESCSRVSCDSIGWGRKRRKAVWFSIPLCPRFSSCLVKLSYLLLLYQLLHMNFKKITSKCFSLCSLLIVCRLQRLSAKDKENISMG